MKSKKESKPSLLAVDHMSATGDCDELIVRLEI
jgi:hypothetical protein